MTRSMGTGLGTRRPSLGLPFSRTPDRLQACIADLAPLHPHLCPRQVLGLRVALRAGELLGIELPRIDERVYVFAETDGCFADSVSVATGCWLGHRTLRLVDHGKSAATFVDTATGRAFRVWPHPTARRRAVELLPEAPSRWHAQRDAYQTMPSSELLVARPVTLEIDIDAIMSRNGKRVVCVCCGEDVINEREVLRGGRPLCRACAGETYVRARAEDTAGGSRSPEIADAACIEPADRVAQPRVQPTGQYEPG